MTARFIFWQLSSAWIEKIKMSWPDKKNHINGVLLLLLPSNTIRNNITGSQNAEDDVLFFGVEPKNLHSRQKSLEVLTVVLGSALAMASLFHGVFIHRNIILNMQNNIFFFVFCFRSKEKVTLFKQKKTNLERNNKLPTNFSSSQNTAKPITVVLLFDLFSLSTKNF